MLLLAPGDAVVEKASAQAACDQYDNCPPTNPPTNPPDNQPNGGAGPGGGEGGELPFTGYPVTPLILLLLLLLATGAALRTYVAVRDRMQARHAGDAPLGLT